MGVLIRLEFVDSQPGNSFSHIVRFFKNSDIGFLHDPQGKSVVSLELLSHKLGQIVITKTISNCDHKHIFKLDRIRSV